MISGIGPSVTLQKHGIKVLKDLPGVGQNLWDQPLFGTTFQVNLGPSPSNPVQVSEYDQNPPVGPLTNAGNPAVGWDSLPPSYLSPSTRQALSQFPSDWPQLEWLAASVGLGNATEGVYRSILTTLVAPLSRGYVTIRSARMADAPIINFNYLTHPGDQEVAIGAFKRQREFWSKLSCITIGVENVPGPSVQTDAEILTYIRSTLSPIWHASATCKMGKQEEQHGGCGFTVPGVWDAEIEDCGCKCVSVLAPWTSTVYDLCVGREGSCGDVTGRGVEEWGGGRLSEPEKRRKTSSATSILGRPGPPSCQSRSQNLDEPHGPPCWTTLDRNSMSPVPPPPPRVLQLHGRTCPADSKDRLC